MDKELIQNLYTLMGKNPLDAVSLAAKLDPGAKYAVGKGGATVDFGLDGCSYEAERRLKDKVGVVTVWGEEALTLDVTVVCKLQSGVLDWWFVVGHGDDRQTLTVDDFRTMSKFVSDFS
jgi:hypothetical protein